ncbi:succinate-semialdehyde dehydrogenase/glutarate-semialdehyde dehydrogenase [Stenotrophomonas sp. PvP093]|uniref:NAD-dependent succinate-semialdehyde dehydrogenase n=1 Tax=Stenotrophomonas TaxID=40323 RepID=UPI0007B2B35E|nr:NAD-dependent succinate-semialdehyde dehydrogenase [Stenotrophomonas sp. PvP093]KZE58564.1 succinate-semialdehyde dehydrogenase [Stenotrophomonas maltophilia]MBP2483160.1 succinate-semialdehyde dehydrogenase/glutarate-semialdehyde dehydrogenase [Stenotrophomonas sp. PvP093]MCF3545597.1 aldehyde dehydrogenase family protein [Stenotrophomonas maltophilia]TNY02304.1 NAD-dependent succinate-semialdehyde dehydrogenase [Stenotrophomonas maltophilia]TPD79361.1 NAD-dependent succinate-semialdehyde 
MTVEIIDPATGQVTYRHELMGAADIEQRLQAAADAFPGWADRSLQDRGAVLRQIAAQLRTRRDDLQQAMTHEMGKLKAEALAEVDKCAAACEYYADHAADYLKPQLIDTEAQRSYVRYEPIGCVFAVMPWNFPVWQVFRFLAPAFMAGNVALLKHASNVPQCADLILAVCRDGGLPEGVFDVLHIDNDQAAEVLRDARVKAVTLTGSERAGRSIASNAGSQLKKSVMELGGSDAFVVLDDADLDKAVAAAVKSRFDNSGQTCIAAKRFIAVDAVADDFTRRFVEAAGQRQYGDPSERGTTLAPMARADLRDELHKQVQASVAKGARVLVGGEPIAGTHAGYPATVLDRVGPGMPAYDEELFGPVAAVIRVKDEAEALRVANDTRFGLGGSVWTRDPVRGEAFAQRMECGAAFVNAIVKSDARLPFGGSKQSGFGRELADHGIHEFMNIKTVYVA